MERDLMELVEGCGIAKPANEARVPEALETVKLLDELGFKKAAGQVARKLHPVLKAAEIAAGKYVEITPAKIKAYLQRKADEYNARLPKKRTGWLGGGLSSTVGSTTLTFTTNTTNIAQSYSQLLAEQQQRNGMLNAANNASWWATPGSVVIADPATDVLQWVPPVATQAPIAPEYYRAYTQGGDINAFEWCEVAVEHYAGIPPMNVLRKFKEEKEKNVFDSFTIASVNAIRDPLLLGRVTGSENRYFIAQWGDDVKLDDVI